MTAKTSPVVPVKKRDVESYRTAVAASPVILPYLLFLSHIFPIVQLFLLRLVLNLFAENLVESSNGSCGAKPKRDPACSIQRNSFPQIRKCDPSSSPFRLSRSSLQKTRSHSHHGGAFTYFDYSIFCQSTKSSNLSCGFLWFESNQMVGLFFLICAYSSSDLVTL